MADNVVICKKSLSINNISNEDKEILLLPFVGKRDDYSDFKLYKGIAYTNELDRDGEIATHDYLVQLAPKLIGCPIIKNHDWYDVDGIVGRVVSAEIVVTDDQEFIQIVFYAIKPEDIANIENGLYYGLSVGSCVNQDGNVLTGCTDAYEVSLVVVPAVPGAHITKSKRNGGDSDMDLDTIRAELEAVRSELETCRAENEDLKAKLAACEQKEFESEANGMLEDKACEAADNMEPSNDTVKGYIVSELKSVGYTKVDSAENAVTLKCGKFISFEAFDKKVNEIKTKYTALGLLGKAEKKVEPKVETKGLNFTPEVVTKKSVSVKRGATVSFD